jgi:hypothetical protein
MIGRYTPLPNTQPTKPQPWSPSKPCATSKTGTVLAPINVTITKAVVDALLMKRAGNKNPALLIVVCSSRETEASYHHPAISRY